MPNPVEAWMGARAPWEAAFFGGVPVALVILVLAYYGCHKQPQAPPAVLEATPAPVAAVATSGTTATGKAGSITRITVLEPPRAPGAAGPSPKMGSRMLDAGAERAIVIEVENTVSAGAQSAATASASASSPVNSRIEATVAPARVGVMLGTLPGVAALDVRIAEATIPPIVFGLPLEVGVDVAGNLSAAGAGVSVGGKQFTTAGAWTSWDLRAQGLYIGAGFRF